MRNALAAVSRLMVCFVLFTGCADAGNRGGMSSGSSSAYGRAAAEHEMAQANSSDTSSTSATSSGSAGGYGTTGGVADDSGTSGAPGAASGGSSGYADSRMIEIEEENERLRSLLVSYQKKVQLLESRIEQLERTR